MTFYFIFAGDYPVWTSCPYMKQTMPFECTPIEDSVLTDKTMNRVMGEEKTVSWISSTPKHKKGDIIHDFHDASSECKRECNQHQNCNSFHIKPLEVGQGYVCLFYKSIINNLRCQKDPGIEGLRRPMTTFMKYKPGDCVNANPNRTELCCDESLQGYY